MLLNRSNRQPAQDLGKRALRLLKQPAGSGPQRDGRSHWVPFRPGAAPASGGEGIGVVPVPVGPGVVLETSTAPGGTRNELLRSLCQVCVCVCG
jgi:hypothetical protein